MRVALDQPLKGERAKDHCSRNMHPGCRSYRRRERRSTPARELGELGFIPVAQAVGLAPSPRPPPCNPTTNKLFHPIFDPRGRSSRRVRELGTGPALGPKNGGPSPDSGTDGRGTSIAPPNDAIHSTV